MKKIFITGVSGFIGRKLTNKLKKNNQILGYCRKKSGIKGIKEIKKIIKGLGKLGTKRMSLVGGEPLLRTDIDQIINYIKKNRMECALTSNGYLLPDMLDKVKKLDLLVLSLDGREKNHDSGREKGSWKKTMKALKIACKNKIPLQISTVISKENLNDLVWLAKLGEKFKLWIAFTPLINQSQENIKMPISRLLPTDKQYHQVFKQIIRLKRKGARFLFPEKVYRMALKWPDFSYIRCQAGRYFALIDSNGDFYPCPQLVDVIKVKNIIKDGLKIAWKYLNNHQCQACPFPCSNNYSLIFALDPLALLDLWKSYKIA